MGFLFLDSRVVLVRNWFIRYVGIQIACYHQFQLLPYTIQVCILNRGKRTFAVSGCKEDT
jgi:hypothetical protein